MSEAVVLENNAETIQDQINELLAEGWRIHTYSASKGGTYGYTTHFALMIREDDPQ